LGLKRPEREAEHSSPSSAEIKNVWGLYLQFSPLFGVVIKDNDSFTFTFGEKRIDALRIKCVVSGRIQETDIDFD
jgi:hypothetical protein